MFKHFIKLKQKNKKMMNTNDRLTNLEYQIKYSNLYKKLIEHKNLYSNYLSKEPILTINMPTYNGEQYIAKALESILMQETTYFYKIKIFDDKSTDNTVKIAEEYKKLYPDIIEIIVNDKNEKGKTVGYKIYNSINTKYWMNFDQDDYWLSIDKLQRLIEFLERNETFTLASSACYIKTSNKLSPVLCEKCDWNLKFGFEYPMPLGVLLQTSATIFRNVFTESDLIKINNYKNTKEEPAIWGDTFRNIFALSKGKGYFENSLDSVYNWVETGTWSKLNSGQQAFYNLEQMYYLINFFDELEYKQHMKKCALRYLKECHKKQIMLTKEEQVKLKEFQKGLMNAK